MLLMTCIFLPDWNHWRLWPWWPRHIGGKDWEICRHTLWKGKFKFYIFYVVGRLSLLWRNNHVHLWVMHDIDISSIFWLLNSSNSSPNFSVTKLTCIVLRIIVPSKPLWNIFSIAENKIFLVVLKLVYNTEVKDSKHRNSTQNRCTAS
jgi:hypothetical protein